MPPPQNAKFESAWKRRVNRARDSAPVYSFEKSVLWSTENNPFDGYRVRPLRATYVGWGYAVLLGFKFRPDVVFSRPASRGAPQEYQCIQISRYSSSLDDTEGASVGETPLRLPLKKGAHTIPAKATVPPEFRARIAVSCSCPDFLLRGGKPIRDDRPARRKCDHGNLYGCKHMMMVNERLERPAIPPTLPDIFNP